MPTIDFDNYTYEFSEYDELASKIIRRASKELFDDEEYFETSNSALEQCVDFALDDLRDALYDDAREQFEYNKDRYAFYGLSRRDFL